MNILLTGGTGFVGQALRPALADHRLWVWMRRDPRPGELPDATAVRGVAEIDQPLDAVINLAGENIGAARWTEARKQALRASRIDLTRQLGRELAAAEQSPTLWINASAVGYYGDRPGETLTEDAAPGEDFAARLCQDWEAAAGAAAPAAARHLILRLGVVIGPGGVLETLRLPFRLGLGAVMGPGPQHMPWVALDDVVAVMQTALDDARYQGVINLVGPRSVDQRQFADAVARAFGRPRLFRFPTPVLRLMMGEMANLLLFDQQVSPTGLDKLDYAFRFADIDAALRAAVATA